MIHPSCPSYPGSQGTLGNQTFGVDEVDTGIERKRYWEKGMADRGIEVGQAEYSVTRSAWTQKPYWLGWGRMAVWMGRMVHSQNEVLRSILYPADAAPDFRLAHHTAVLPPAASCTTVISALRTKIEMDYQLTPSEWLNAGRSSS
jgi:hypothetical protein